MLARCAQCHELFRTERQGRQFCPQCGAELMLSQTGEPPAQSPSGSNLPPANSSGPGQPRPPETFLPGPPAPGGAIPPPAGSRNGSTPWEERARLGFFPAFFETLRLTLIDPGTFFARMRVDRTDGAVTYFWLTAGVGTFVQQLWQLAFGTLGAVGSKLLPGDHPLSRVMEGATPGTTLVWALFSFALSPLALYVAAGVFHLFLLVFGGAKRGFDGTLKVTAYSFGPSLLGFFPLCGGLLGSIWAAVLVAIGLSKAHRTDPWRAVMAVLTPMLLACCALVAVAIATGLAIAAAAGLSH